MGTMLIVIKPFYHMTITTVNEVIHKKLLYYMESYNTINISYSNKDDIMMMTTMSSIVKPSEFSEVTFSIFHASKKNLT